MKLIKADEDRRLEIPGVPGLVSRPVDIDKALTGFANLRSLRVYRFDAESVINGHAEEDEVFVIVLAGSIELTVSEVHSEEVSQTFALSAARDSATEACVAYLPPLSAYRLVSQTDSEIAYARATPPDGPPSAVFAPRVRVEPGRVAVLLEETSYARRLRLRLMQIEAGEDGTAFKPLSESEAMQEALIHVRSGSVNQVVTITSDDAEPSSLNSWDTVAVAPGDHPTLRVLKQSSALVVLVFAV